MSAKRTQARDWLRLVCAKLPGGGSTREIDRRMGLAATLLASRFPLEAFTEASAAAVAAGLTEFPDGEALAGRLNAYLQANAPYMRSHDLPEIDLPDAEDCAWARNWLRHSLGDWGRHADGSDARGGESNLRMQLDRIRKLRFPVFNWLVLHNDDAAKIAAQAGWNDRAPGQHQAERNDDDRAHASVTVAEALTAMAERRRAEPSFAADRPGVARKLDEAIDEFQRGQPRPARAPVELTDEQLEQARKAAGISMPPRSPREHAVNDDWNPFLEAAE